MRFFRNLPLSLFFNSSAFYGNRLNRWSRSTSFYFRSIRKNFFLFDGSKAVFMLRRAALFLGRLAGDSPHLLFVGQSLPPLPPLCSSLFPYRPGTLSNYRTVGLFSRFLGPPSVLCLLDCSPSSLHGAYEASRLAIPTLGLLEGGSDPLWFTYPIPLNGFAASSRRAVLHFLLGFLRPPFGSFSLQATFSPPLQGAGTR